MTVLALDKPDLAPSGFDLRRHVSRDECQVLIDRAVHLPPIDRALIRAVYEKGHTAAEVARIRAECPRHIRSRVRALTVRLLSERFVFVIDHRAEWPRTRARIATLHIVQGRTLRETADALHLSLHSVRAHMHTINALILDATR